MRVVSENSEADLARQESLYRMGWAVRELTANLLRITRGAGKPHEVMRQVTDLAAAMRGYHAVTGFGPVDEMAHLPDVSESWETMQSWSAENQEREYAKQAIRRGVLQIVASRLVGQKPQEAAGDYELQNGMNELKRVQAEANKAWEASRRAVAVSTRSSKPKAKVGRPKKPL